MQNLRWFLQAATVVAPACRMCGSPLPAFKPQQAQFGRKSWSRRPACRSRSSSRRTPELIHLADCCMAVSGSVSLELLYQTKPTVILYWIGRLGYFVQDQFRRVKYITLVNLLTARSVLFEGRPRTTPRRTDKILFPEYVTCEDKTLQIAAHVIRWLVDEETREGLVAELAKLKGALVTAALPPLLPTIS